MNDDSNPLKSHYSLSEDYALLRDYLYGGGTIAQLLTVLSEAETQIQSDRNEGNEVQSDRMLDVAGMLRYALGSIDYDVLDRSLQGLRDEFDAKHEEISPHSDNVAQDSKEVAEIFVTLDQCVEARIIVQTKHRTLRAKNVFLHAFPWLSNIEGPWKARAGAVGHPRRVHETLKLAQLLDQNLVQAKSAASSLIQIRFDPQVLVPEKLRGLQIIRGRTCSYVDALARLERIVQRDWHSIVGMLHAWEHYLKTWQAEFSKVLDEALSAYRPCLIGDNDFWQSYMRPRMC